MKPKSAELVTLEQDAKGYPPPIRVTKAAHAKRLLSRLIFNLQAGTVSNQTAKDLAYLCITYVQLCQATEFEERLSRLEEQR